MERDDWDILRSEGEGLGTVNYDQLSEEEIEAGELHVFLNKIVDEFKRNSELSGIEEASIEILKGMGDKEKQSLLELAKRHFVPSVCHLHTKEIVNDETYVEDLEVGGLEGPIIDWELNVPNLGRFLVLEGSEGLRAHIKERVGDKKWQELEDIEMVRIMNYDRWIKGGSSG